MSKLRIPVSFADIDSAWVNGVFEACRSSAEQAPRHACAPLRAEPMVASIALERVGVGTGFMSSLTRVYIESKNDKIPSSIVVKLCAQDKQARDLATAFNSYRNEVGFYANYAQLVPVLVPRCYAHALDGDRFVLVLEDLHEHRAGNQVAGATAADVISCVEAMAELHGAFWNSAPSAMASMRKSSAVAHAGLAELIEQALAVTEVAVSEALAQFLCAYTRTPLVQGFVERYGVSLVHTDFRLDNLFFHASNGQVIVLDWQDVCAGAPAFDLAHFLMSNVNPGLRKRVEYDAVSAYQRRLNGTFNNAMSLSDVWDAYRCYMPMALYIPALIAVRAQSTDTGAELGRTVMHRAVAALEFHLDAIVQLNEHVH